eukprot:6182876-Pleurochrysis_carterae.AAC.1
MHMLVLLVVLLLFGCPADLFRRWIQQPRATGEAALTAAWSPTPLVSPTPSPNGCPVTCRKRV